VRQITALFESLRRGQKLLENPTQYRFFRPTRSHCRSRRQPSGNKQKTPTLCRRLMKN